MGNCLKSTRTNSDFFVITSNERQVNQENEATPRHPPPPYQIEDPILHPTPGVSRPVSELTEEEQVKIAIRLGLISTLPFFIFEEEKREKLVECIICMCEYEVGEELRYLPCLHTYHKACIDDWLTRSFVCPSCLDEVDIALMRSPKATKINSPEINQSNSDTQVITSLEAGDHSEDVTGTNEDTVEQQDKSSEVVHNSNEDKSDKIFQTYEVSTGESTNTDNTASKKIASDTSPLEET